jgi:C-methyltransferase C-terminal domain
VTKVLSNEEAAALHTLAGHAGFSAAVLQVKRDLLELLIDASRKGLSVAGYGAPGKGNTLLNHCGIRSDLLEYTVDRNPYKHGRYLPGTHIPIFAPDRIRETRPDLVLVLPWNLRDEIVEQIAYIREWGGRFIIPIPQPTVI